MISTKHYQTLKLQSIVIAVVFIAGSWIGILFLPAVIVFPVTGALAIGALSWRLFRLLHRQIEMQQFLVFRQTEALMGLYGTLDIKHPLPTTRQRAASPDFLHLTTREIFRRKPELIIEVGSGASTLVAAYCLRKLGRGKIISLDHMEKYADISRQTLETHELDDIAEVIYAPLKEYQIGKRKCLWYDDEVLQSLERVDMFVIDGPPRNVAADSRYAAIPLLAEKLHAKSVVLLDDGTRPGEKEIVEQWKQEYGLDYSFQEMEKGAFICYFPNHD